MKHQGQSVYGMVFVSFFVCACVSFNFLVFGGIGVGNPPIPWRDLQCTANPAARFMPQWWSVTPVDLEAGQRLSASPTPTSSRWFQHRETRDGKNCMMGKEFLIIFGKLHPDVLSPYIFFVVDWQLLISQLTSLVPWFTVHKLRCWVWNRCTCPVWCGSRSQRLGRKTCLALRKSLPLPILWKATGIHDRLYVEQWL